MEKTYFQIKSESGFAINVNHIEDAMKIMTDSTPAFIIEEDGDISYILVGDIESSTWTTDVVKEGKVYAFSTPGSRPDYFLVKN